MHSSSCTMISLTVMPRRSPRLQSTGYYDSEGTPSISYKETLYRIFRRRRDRSSSSSRRQSISSRASNYRSFSRTSSNGSYLSDISSIGSYVTSRSRNRGKNSNMNRFQAVSNGNSHGDRNNTESKAPTMFYLKIFVFLLMMLPLCFGLAYLRSVILVSQPTDSAVPPTVLDKDLNAERGDIAKHLQELQNEMLKLNTKIKHLLPDADTWPNFALESLGARVLPHQSSKSYLVKGEGIVLFGIPLWTSSVSPKTVIQGHAPLMPGCCWAFEGGRGHLSIALSHPVTISHVTLGHITNNLSPTGTITSAPKEFSVYGMETPDGEGTKLGTFLYDQDGDSAQTFKIPDHKKGVFSYVKLQVETNWGHPDYSCLYSFKVHGKLAD